MEVHRISKEDWKNLARDAHKICFQEIKDPSSDRIDYALIVSEGPLPLGYVTCREWDQETLYWQFGGAFPSARGTVLTYPAYREFIAWCKSRYKRITTLIENTNLAMLKIAMKVGFKIVGIRNFAGSILLEHLLEFEGV